MVFPLAKCPGFGRIGPKRWQDWYRSCVKVVRIKRQLVYRGHRVEVLLVNKMQVEGYPPENDYYLEVLREFGEHNPKLALQSFETIRELEGAVETAKSQNAQLIVVSTFGHYLRAAWLLRGTWALHRTVFGLPRYREFVTDCILTILFPIIDVCGGRKWFQSKVVGRRKSGKH